MTRGRLDAVPPPAADASEGSAGSGQFYADFEGHLKFHLAGVWAEEGAECEHLGIECRHLACCGSRAQLFYSPTGDVTRPLLQEPSTAAGASAQKLRILTSVQEYLWNWFVIPDIGNLAEAELDRWLHPVMQGSAFSGVEKDESGGACCSLTLVTRLGRSRGGLRPLRTGADEFGRVAGSRQCEQLLDWTAGSGGGGSRQRMAFVSHCAQLPLLMRRNFPLIDSIGPSSMSKQPQTQQPAVELHPDSRRQAATLRRWLSGQLDRLARFGGGGASPLPLLLLRPSASPLDRSGQSHCQSAKRLSDSLEAAFEELRRQLKLLSAEASSSAGPPPSAWSYLELPAADTGDEAVLAMVAASVGSLRLVGSGNKASTVSRQTFSVCMLDVETVESALPDLAALGQAMLVAQLRGHCSGSGGEAARATRFVRGVLQLAEHAWQLARDSARLAEAQLVTDRPARMVDDRVSMLAKADAWMHLDLLTQLATDMMQRRPRGPETLLAACSLATWPSVNRSRTGYLHCGFVADGEEVEPDKSAGRAAPDPAEACFAWLVAALERGLTASESTQQRPFLGSGTLALPAGPATEVAAAAAATLASADKPLANLMKLTLRHGLLALVCRDRLHLVNLLCLWRLPSISEGSTPSELSAAVDAAVESVTASCPVAAVWTVPAEELAGVSLRLADGGSGFLVTMGFRSAPQTVCGVVTATPGVSWTGRQLEPRDQRWRSAGGEALRFLRLLEALRPSGSQSPGLLRFRGVGASVAEPNDVSAGERRHPYELANGPALLRRALTPARRGSTDGPSSCLMADCLRAFLRAGAGQ
ncbi:hypothetical protein BOX15_Mlig024554g2 [Macrostomum lignano]|uniref:SAC domain-containing protein n=1 Tax=Macrostomum lignano TaxID=282301 RepID=A0A267GK62_9PLAT|nr:hypothetical protein BOX15_Mlig024554g2 [Macrostomum lignano]